VYVFSLTGTAVVVDWAARRTPAAWRTIATTTLTATVAVAGIHLATTRDEPLQIYHVDHSTAKDLDRVAATIPVDAEIIASFGIAGRFADRRHLFLHAHENQVMPVRAKQVVFVFAPWAGNQPIPQAQVVAVAHHLRDTLHARPLLDGPLVFAYRWTPPPTAESVVLSVAGD
jgi:hypothetical protein